MKKKDVNLNKAAQALGRKGGAARFKKYGKEAMAEMANRRWEAYRKNREELSTENA
ncbi:MAG: hypothetical protein WC764_04285 [Candidatus Paceibacterota bacterium]|jgi:hypothetical protein